MGANASKVHGGNEHFTDSDHELLRFTWFIVANADYNRPQVGDDDAASIHSMHSIETANGDGGSDHVVDLHNLIMKNVFHVAFYEKFFKLSPESRALFPENRSRAGEVLKVMINAITTGTWEAGKLEHIVKVHAKYKLTKAQMEAFALAFARTMEYKLDRLCTVYISKLWERACLNIAMIVYKELKKIGATGD